MRRNTFISEDEFKVIQANLERGKVGGGVDRDARCGMPDRSVTRKASGVNSSRRHLNASPAGSTPAPPPQKREYDSKLPRELIIVGQMPSGKTSGVKVGYTKAGKLYRYPNARFKAWREEAVVNLIKQWKDHAVTIPVRLHCLYWPGDRRTRDVPGIEDAMFHVLVKAGVLKDDGLVYDCLWYRQPMNTKGPKVLITITQWI